MLQPVHAPLPQKPYAQQQLQIFHVCHTIIERVSHAVRLKSHLANHHAVLLLQAPFAVIV